MNSYDGVKVLYDAPNLMKKNNKKEKNVRKIDQKKTDNVTYLRTYGR